MKDIFIEKPVGRRTWNQPGAAGIFYAQAVNKKCAYDAARGWTVTKIVRTNTKRQVWITCLILSDLMDEDRSNG